MGDPLGSPRVAPLFDFLYETFLNNAPHAIATLQLSVLVAPSGRKDGTKELKEENISGAIIPALMHRIPSELRS